MKIKSNQGQARQSSELIIRLEDLTQALNANEASSKRKNSEPGHMGPKRKFATSYDQSNYACYLANACNDVTSANVENDYEMSDNEDDNISIPDQDIVEKDIEILLGSDVPGDKKSPPDSLLDKIAEDLYRT